jgi:hypothetical protein
MSHPSRSSFVPLIAGLILAAGTAFAAEPASGDAAQADASRAQADAIRTQAEATRAKLEAARAKLEAARAKLEAESREIARMSMDLAQEEVRDLRVGHGHRAVIGVGLGEEVDGRGIRISSVSPGGPAATAGLQAGDLILSVGGKSAKSPGEVAHEVHALTPGTVVEIEYERGGKSAKAQVHTGSLDDHTMVWIDPDMMRAQFDTPEMHELMRSEHWPLLHGGSPWSDMELATLTRSLGRYFGADRGVLVVQAPSGVNGMLQDGDVITGIDGRDPTDVDHTLRILGSHQAGETVKLALLRERKALSVELVVPKRSAFRAPPAPPRPPVPPAPHAPATPAAPAAPPAPAAPSGAEGV